MIEKFLEFARSVIAVTMLLAVIGFTAKVCSYPILWGWGLLP